MTASTADPSVRVVLLAGGKGTRFWPASRVSRPKQFLRLFGDRTLLRMTFDRFARIVPPDRIYVLTNQYHADLIREEIPELPAENLLLEPSGKDTAPAAALAARELRRFGAATILVVAPTDHYVQDEDAFAAALRQGIDEARGGSLVTFGVVPDRPATGYGYIEVRPPRADGSAARDVLRFHEKPDAKVAAAYVASGSFFWNAGIFAWRIDVFDRELSSAAPELARAIAALPPCVQPRTSPFEAWSAAWEALPARSIDYALMEKASRVACVPLAAGWSDVGSWDAARALMPSDDAGNLPSPDVLYVGARSCAVHRCESSAAAAGQPPARRLYAIVGASDLVIVESPDAVLVCAVPTGESLREVVRELEAKGRKDLL